MTKVKTIFSMDLVASMAVAELAGQAGRPPEEMLIEQALEILGLISRRNTLSPSLKILSDLLGSA